MKKLKKEIEQIEKMEKMVNREDLLYKANKYV